MQIEYSNQCLTIWIGKSISMMANYCPNWDHPKLAFHENGGRREHECLDLNWSIWRMAFSITFWNIGWMAKILQYIPTKEKSGYSIGWF